jgi:ABC-2 type transport system permease protein
MILAIRAEWTKLRTVAGPGWLLIGAVALTVALSVLVTAQVTCPAAGCTGDPTRISLTGVQLGQVLVVVLAVLAVGGEYSTGMVRTTLTAVPRRERVLVAKAATVAVPVLCAGTVAVLGCVLAGRLLLPGRGFTAAHGQQVVSLAAGPTLRAATGSVLYLGLIALLSLGVGALLRDTAATVGLVLGLLYLWPILIHVITDVRWQHRLERWTPLAGLNVQATTGIHGLPIGPWPGLGVLALWAAGALLAGTVALRLRDA